MKKFRLAIVGLIIMATAVANLEASGAGWRAPRKCDASGCPPYNNLFAGEQLVPNSVEFPSEIRSSYGTYSFIMQGDGNLVLYRRGVKACWASNTAGKGGTRVVMQGDGNLVMYTAANVPVWASNTYSTTYAIDYELIMHDDGRAILYRHTHTYNGVIQKTALWSTPTYGC